MHLSSCIIVFLIIFVSSCSEKAKVKEDRGNFYIYFSEKGISEIKEVRWKVGKYLKQEVSRGFRIRFNLPLLETEVMKSLYAKKKIDSWLVKLKKVDGRDRRVMGHYSIPFVSRSGRGDIRYHSPKGGNLGINYAAASISMRMDRLPCPALGHRTKIINVDVLKEQRIRKKLISVNSGELSRISSKVPAIGHNSVSINGGSVLKGKYKVELALYNQQEKMKNSNFVELDGYADILETKKIVIKGCQNYQLPSGPITDPPNRFKFGR